MFAKILVPSDGSALGNISALRGIEFAAKVGAEVVAINVTREFQAGYVKADAAKAEYEAAAKEASNAVLQPLKDAAAKAGVKFTGVNRVANHTALAIVKAASDSACDLIFIGSHGCAGWDHVLMGSVSNKVLATATVPVLVYRLKENEVPEGVSHSYDASFPPA